MILNMHYIRGVFREFKNIRWLPLRRTVFYTILVMVVGVLVGFALGAIDNLISEFIGYLTF